VVSVLHNITNKCSLLVVDEWMNIRVAKDAFAQRGRNEMRCMMMMIVCFGMNILLVGDCNGLLRPM
jgi:hypothetical protein